MLLYLKIHLFLRYRFLSNNEGVNILALKIFGKNEKNQGEMLQLLQKKQPIKGTSSKVRFDGRQSTGNRYYTGLIRMELAGLHGDEKQIYVLDPSKMYLSVHKFSDPAYIISNSVLIGGASLGLKAAVIRHIAYREVGISISIPILLESLPGGEKHYGRTRHNFRYNYYTRKIIRVEGVLSMIIHPYSVNMKRSHYYDIYLNLVHEKHHAENTNHFIGKKIEQNGEVEESAKIYSEYLAYTAVLEHHYYKYASAQYQDHVHKQFDYYEKCLNR